MIQTPKMKARGIDRFGNTHAIETLCEELDALKAEMKEARAALEDIRKFLVLMRLR